MRIQYPFSAIVDQEEMKRAIIIAAIDPSVGGVLVFGDRGTGKSTAVRALAGLLPTMTVMAGCVYGCDPEGRSVVCADCAKKIAQAFKADKKPKTARQPVPVVDLPLGATEDRVVGALDLEKALVHGEKSFEPGLLAKAHRGFVYVDEVNLLEDHLVDLLLDVAASGENLVEREGMSLRHPARFVLVGSGNPEEGELRPQLLDRFGLSVEVATPTDPKARVEIIRRRDTFERDPQAFADHYDKEEGALRRKIVAAQKKLDQVELSDQVLEQAASLCIALGTDGLRGELTLIRASRALAAFDKADSVSLDHIKTIAPSALRHRLRRDPLDETGSAVRIERAMQEVFANASGAS